MPPRVYECEVFHQRLKPRRNGFRYRVFMIDVDLDSLDETARTVRGLRHNRFGLFSIDDRDHIDLGLPGGIRPNLIGWMKQHDVEVPADSRIRLVTFPRVLGYGFNPVSFYYINDADGRPLMAVAEVVNTFREMKLYPVGEERVDDRWQRVVAKDFYVSPFSDPGDRFDFRLGIPGGEWRVDIDNLDAEGKTLVSSIRGVARPLTSLRLYRFAFKYPLLSLKIIGGIHWHALLLWMRGFPFLRKAERTDAQKDVLRPHHTLHRNRS
ncbi:MAG: DUF1365 domain-containing protein [Verrucomicrobiaceae bacterium]|nr:MAG: DUF1365 domain-containing protein [Verrucomicrobiaceae bacterium]